MIISNSWDKDSNLSSYINFRNDFINRYNREPGFAETYGFETMLILQQALLNLRNIAPLEIKNEILTKKIFEGLIGDIIFNDFGESTRNFFIFEIKNNDFKKVD